MSVVAGTPRLRPSSGRLAPLLDRPDVILQVVPLGAVYVGALQLSNSAGPDGLRGVIGLVAVTAFFLGQSLLLLRRPGWAESRHAVLFLGSAPFASPLYELFLVDCIRPLMWLWLIPPVLMITAYLCRAVDVWLTAVVVYAAGTLFVVRSGIPLGSEPWLLAVTYLAWAAPCLLTRLVLGNLRHAAEQVQEMTSRDPLTRVLNRDGLDAGFVALLDRIKRSERDEPVELSVLVVDLDGFKKVSERLGNTAADAALVRTADALTRAFRRDHVVARLRAGIFVVVSSHPVEQLAPVLLSEVRRANADAGLTASIGAVEGVPASSVPSDRLGSLVRIAEGRLAEAKAAGGDCSRAVRLDPRRALPGPVDSPAPLPDLTAHLARVTTERPADTGLLGAALSVIAVLVVLVPQEGDAPGTHVAFVVGGSAVLAALGVLVAAGWLRHGLWQALGICLALGVSAASVPTAATDMGHLVALTIVPFGAYTASLTMRRTLAAALTCVLPVVSGFVLWQSADAVDRPLATYCGLLGFTLLTCALALWVRRVQDQTRTRMLVLSRIDAGTGLLGREGLVDHYGTLPAGTEVALVYLDVDDMAHVNRTYGLHGGDSVLRRVGAALQESVGSDGVAARVGGDEFVLLVTGPAGSSRVLRRLTERLAAEEVPVRLSLGQAFGVVDQDTSLWRLMSHADEALLLNRSRDRRSSAPRTSRPHPGPPPDGRGPA